MRYNNNPAPPFRYGDIISWDGKLGYYLGRVYKAEGMDYCHVIQLGEGEDNTYILYSCLPLEHANRGRNPPFVILPLVEVHFTSLKFYKVF